METEPRGMCLSPAQNTIWTPKLQGNDDFPIIEYATSLYSQKDVQRINRYRLYLQLIIFYDLITYDGSQIHPDLLLGSRIASRKSTIYWIDFPKPPKKDLALWQAFLNMYIKPLLSSKIIRWDTNSTPHY